MTRKNHISPLSILQRVAELKSHALLILCIALLTACASDNDPVVTDPDPQPEKVIESPISFGGSIFEDTENTTRAATGADAATLLSNKFIVYGYKTVGTDLQTIFPGYTVQYTANTANTTTTNTCGWEYDGLQTDDAEPMTQSIKYWDTSAEEYRVFGISSKTNTTVTTDATKTDIVFTLDATTDAGITATPYFSDLWYKAKANLLSCVNSPIQLTFRKPLCKVRLMFVDENGNQYTSDKGLTKGSIKFQPANTADKLAVKGTFTLTYPISSGSATSYSYSSSATETITALTEPYETGSAVFATTTEKWYTLLPLASQGDFTLTATVGGKDKEVTIPKELVQWKPSYSYTYVFKISDTNIVLINVNQVAIKSWDADTKDIDHPVYNW